MKKAKKKKEIKKKTEKKKLPPVCEFHKSRTCGCYSVQ